MVPLVLELADGDAGGEGHIEFVDGVDVVGECAHPLLMAVVKGLVVELVGELEAELKLLANLSRAHGTTVDIIPFHNVVFLAHLGLGINLEWLHRLYLVSFFCLG